MYVRFMFTLAAGLTGLGFVLTTLLESVFNDWDPIRAARRWWRRLGHGRSRAPLVSAEDILQELEGRSRYERPAPQGQLAQRREVLREMREAEARLASPEAVEV